MTSTPNLPRLATMRFMTQIIQIHLINQPTNTPQNLAATHTAVITIHRTKNADATRLQPANCSLLLHLVTR